MAKTDDDDVAIKVAMTANALAAAAACTTDHVGDAVPLTLMAATGAFAVTHMLICREDINDPESNLFIGILTGLCARPTSSGHVAFEYNGAVIVEAMAVFERATGHKADRFLKEGFVTSGREYVAMGEAEGDRLLAEFQAARRNGLN